jgi:hypothetical protein
MHAIDRLERAVRSRLPKPSAEIQTTLTRDIELVSNQPESPQSWHSFKNKMRDPETTDETKVAQLREPLDYLAIANRTDKSKPPHSEPKSRPSSPQFGLPSHPFDGPSLACASGPRTLVLVPPEESRCVLCFVGSALNKLRLRGLSSEPS